jgi:hypothetical protein
METLGWFLFEAFGAAIFLVLLIWWTLPKRHKQEKPIEKKERPEDSA